MRPTSLFVLVCFAAIEFVLASNSDLHEWEQFKQMYGKVYETQKEDTQRFGLYLMTKARIRQHNANATTSYELSLNHFSDWTRSETEKLRAYNYNATEYSKRIELSRQDPLIRWIHDDSTPIPNEVDWRKMPNRVTAVKDQGLCASGWAFATTGVLEGQQVVKDSTKSLVDLSEQELIDCSQKNFGCEGGQVYYALDDTAKLGGLESEQAYPSEKSAAKECRFNKEKVVMTVSGALQLDRGEESLKKAVAKFGPVAITLDAMGLDLSYKSGIFDDATACGDELNHSVLIVGYGKDPKHGDYWIGKNSWSDKWGEQGYFRIKRGSKMCNIGFVSTIPKF